MTRDTKLYIEDILKSIEKIEDYVMDYDEEKFLNNEQIQDAVVRRLEIIGEAIKNVSKSIKEDYPLIPWKEIAGFRDIIVHAYFGINMKRVWLVIENDLPKLKENIKKILKNNKNGTP